MPQKKRKQEGGSGVAIGAGIAATLVAAAAGAYFLYGKDAPKRRKAVRSWALKAKAEVLEQIEKLPDLDRDTYYGLIDAAAARYLKVKDVSSEEVADLARELRGYWNGIRKQFAPAKATRKAARKGVKKAAKKTARKGTRKAAKKTARRK